MISIDSSRCKGCGTCSLVCPHRVIEVSDRKARLAVEDRCIECGACQLNCRDEAITVTKGTGCLFAIASEIWFKKPPGTGVCGGDSTGRSDCGCC